MAIILKEIPSDLLVPGGYIEFDPSRAGTLNDASTILMVGEKIKSASAGLNTIHRIQSETDIIDLFGKDSMLFGMLQYALKHNYACEIYGAAVEDEDSVAPLDMQTLIDAMGDDQYDYVGMPYLELDVLTKLRDECDRRFHAMQANRTHIFSIADADFDTVDTLTLALNSSHITIAEAQDIQEGKQPLWVAALTAIAGDRLHNDPARACTNIELPEISPPATVYETRRMNENLHAGISTWRVVGNKVLISYLVTTYRKNSSGDKDTAYRDIQVPEILKRFRRRLNYEVNKTYISANYKLAKNAGDYPAGTLVVDPIELSAFVYGLYKDLFVGQKAWMQNPENYKSTLIMEIDPENDDRINYMDQPKLIGQFRVFAGRSQFLTK